MKLNLFKTLICDDSILIRKQLKDFLVSNGCSEVYEAIDGKDAIEKYKQYNPDLVFMDIVMPVKSGIEAVSEIIKYDKNAKIVMSSSSGTKTHIRKALEAGAFEFIQKPIEENQLLNILNSFKGDA